MNRCVNIDWLEVFCAEQAQNAILDANYYRLLGYDVRVRDYGTPQYRDMFTIWRNGFPFLEIRRNPYSLKANGGIFNPNDCHIRLSNRSCYDVSPINDLRKFLITFQYSLKSLSRIDICLDFNRFDYGQLPAQFLRAYMRGKVSKINQCNISAHGKDSFAERVWNSVKWGSVSSPISTKLYCKSLELSQVHEKLYIRDAWKLSGLDVSKPVWRV